MRARLLELQRRAAVWATIRWEMVRSDDRGAVTTETVIITAIVGTAAAALGVWLTANILGWRGRIPTP
jgi:hypothetical protein